MTLRLLSYNIKYGGAGREDPIAAVIRTSAPDVVIFQEATRPAVIERIAALTGMAQWASSRGESLGFMSRQTVAHYAWHHPRFSRHAFLEILPADEGVRIFGVHLSAVHAAWTERRRTFELRALLASIARHQSGFHVLAGDFNTVAPGDVLDLRKLPHRLRALVWLSGGKIRWRTIQRILDAGYVDAYRALHPDNPGFSFPSWDPHVRLDYLFVPAAFASRMRTCEVLSDPPAGAGSDHLPLIAEIQT